MSRWSLLLVAACALVAIPPAVTAPVPPPKRPVIEVVFCVDVTRDMAGALASLRRHVFALCRHGQQARSGPILRIGLVAYRDRGDAFVTRLVDLTADLDHLRVAAQELTADGGGDAPESVQQALYEAVHLMTWSGEKSVARHLVLVGSAPPHTDYDGDVPFAETCRAAVGRGIIIHAVQVGDDAECAGCWQDIARLGGGRYARLVAEEGPFPAVVPLP